MKLKTPPVAELLIFIRDIKDTESMIIINIGLVPYKVISRVGILLASHFTSSTQLPRKVSPKSGKHFVVCLSAI